MKKVNDVKPLKNFLNQLILLYLKRKQKIDFALKLCVQFVINLKLHI